MWYHYIHGCAGVSSRSEIRPEGPVLTRPAKRPIEVRRPRNIPAQNCNAEIHPPAEPESTNRQWTSRRGVRHAGRCVIQLDSVSREGSKTSPVAPHGSQVEKKDSPDVPQYDRQGPSPGELTNKGVPEFDVRKGVSASRKLTEATSAKRRDELGDRYEAVVRNAVRRSVVEVDPVARAPSRNLPGFRPTLIPLETRNASA